MNARKIWEQYQETLRFSFPKFEAFENWFNLAVAHNNLIPALKLYGITVIEDGHTDYQQPNEPIQISQNWGSHNLPLPPMPSQFGAPPNHADSRQAASAGWQDQQSVVPATQQQTSQMVRDWQPEQPLWSGYSPQTASHVPLQRANDPQQPKAPTMVRADRAMKQTERYSDKRVARSLLVLFFETAMSIIMVVVDFLTNIAFFVGGSGVFEPLSQSTPIHWAFGALFVFSEPVAFWKTRHTWEALKNRDFEDAAKHGTAAFAAWLAVAVNFVATYLPMEGQVKGAGEPWSWIIGLSIALLAAYFSAEVFKNILSLWRALSR